MTTRPYDARTLRMVQRRLLEMLEGWNDTNASIRANGQAEHVFYANGLGYAAVEIADFIDEGLGVELDRVKSAKKRKAKR